VETEELFQIKLTEKTLAEFEEQIKEEQPVQPVKQDLFSQYLPGFSIIKNIVIKPLLIASERIVEQIMPEREEERKLESGKKVNLEQEEL